MSYHLIYVTPPILYVALNFIPPARAPAVDSSMAFPSTPPATTTEAAPVTTGPSVPLVVVDPGSSVGCDVKDGGAISQRDLLLVVIPSVVVLIVVVLIAVTAGIIICLCLTKSPQGER